MPNYEELEAIAKIKSEDEIIYLILPKSWLRPLALVGTGFFFAMPSEKHYVGTFHGCYVRFEDRQDIGVERFNYA